jgi:hypothetical protein
VAASKGGGSRTHVLAATSISPQMSKSRELLISVDSTSTAVPLREHCGNAGSLSRARQATLFRLHYITVRGRPVPAGYPAVASCRRPVNRRLIWCGRWRTAPPGSRRSRPRLLAGRRHEEASPSLAGPRPQWHAGGRLIRKPSTSSPRSWTLSAQAVSVRNVSAGRSPAALRSRRRHAASVCGLFLKLKWGYSSRLMDAGEILITTTGRRCGQLIGGD